MTSLSAADCRGLARSLLIYYAPVWRTLRLRRFYAGFIRPGDLVFDIGAHVGHRSRVLASLGARVVAVEPQALFAGFLRRTLPTGVVLEPVAVGASAGEATLLVSSRHPTVSSGSPAWIDRVRGDPGFAAVRWDRTETVPRTTLDGLIARHGAPEFVKIDVEGMEAEILRGLATPLPRLAFEYLPAALDLAADCVGRLAALGPYRFNAVRGEQAAFAWPRWLGPGEVAAALRELAAPGGHGDLYAFRADALPPA